MVQELPPIDLRAKHRRTGLIVLTLAVLLVIGLCAVGFWVGTADVRPSPTTTPPVVTHTVADEDRVAVPPMEGDPEVTPAPAPKPKPEKPAIGEGVWHVGDDVPAGTYRAVTPVDPSGLCYWMRAKDDAGQNIVANGIPTGGRPQVTLRKGEWFTSQGCPIWVKR